ncbi:MAG: hypothetical protein A2836_01475 [Candidatus Taylorbacteria bacterium RIFCSPHIGHO2_01_FULL_45_63]|nr:MAG: hypothetical protein A2836_01475 [Candidatus Taylorbacteria bacterium RIFCSPHIGHO2_01_FULL_45_63]OHA34907.1 MAG: hypothetical protein A3A22_02975 [Candidatus Taylorbacteria bacterium RIFCSPLOWO2_01_FULL_45_34b]
MFLLWHEATGIFFVPTKNTEAGSRVLRLLLAFATKDLVTCDTKNNLACSSLFVMARSCRHVFSAEKTDETWSENFASGYE